MKLDKFATLVVSGIVCAAVAIPAAGATVAETKAAVSVVRVPQGGEPVAAQVGPDGVIHLLYNLGDIPYYVKSSDEGATFTAPLPVVNREARKPGLKFEAWSVAVGKGGSIYVAMSTNNWQTKLPNVPVGLVYSELAPEAKFFTPARSLNQKPSEGFL